MPPHHILLMKSDTLYFGILTAAATTFRFHSGSASSVGGSDTNGKGFHIEYSTTVLRPFTACGGNYSNASGVISFSHPNPYPHLADCVYLISQPNGTYINISFLSMDIDCQGTPSDYIEMRDGYSEDSPLMARFCGNGSNVPNFMLATQTHLRIR